MGNPLCYFELMVSDVEKAKDFYTAVFDWTITKSGTFGDTGYHMIDTGTEPQGGLMKKPDQAPHFALGTYILVDSIEETIEKATGAGAKPGVPKTEIPTMGWWAMFFDPDGIPIMLYEPIKK